MEYTVFENINNFLVSEGFKDGDKFKIYKLSEEIDKEDYLKSGKSVEEYADKVLENWDVDYYNQELYYVRDSVWSYLLSIKSVDDNDEMWEKVSDYVIDNMKNIPDKEEILDYLK